MVAGDDVSEALQIFFTGPASLMETYNRYIQEHNSMNNAYIACASTAMLVSRGRNLRYRNYRYNNARYRNRPHSRRRYPYVVNERSDQDVTANNDRRYKRRVTREQIRRPARLYHSNVYRGRRRQRMMNRRISPPSSAQRTDGYFSVNYNGGCGNNGGTISATERSYYSLKNKRNRNRRYTISSCYKSDNFQYSKKMSPRPYSGYKSGRRKRIPPKMSPPPHPHPHRRRRIYDDRDIISGRYSDRSGLRMEIRSEYTKKRINRRTPRNCKSNRTSTIQTERKSFTSGRVRRPFYNSRRRNRIAIRTKKARKFSVGGKEIGNPVRKLKKKQQAGCRIKSSREGGRPHYRAVINEPEDINPSIDMMMKGNIKPNNNNKDRMERRKNHGRVRILSLNRKINKKKDYQQLKQKKQNRKRELTENYKDNNNNNNNRRGKRKSKNDGKKKILPVGRNNKRTIKKKLRRNNRVKSKTDSDSSSVPSTDNESIITSSPPDNDSKSTIQTSSDGMVETDSSTSNSSGSGNSTTTSTSSDDSGILNETATESSICKQISSKKKRNKNEKKKKNQKALEKSVAAKGKCNFARPPNVKILPPRISKSKKENKLSNNNNNNNNEMKKKDYEIKPVVAIGKCERRKPEKLSSAVTGDGKYEKAMMNNNNNKKKEKLAEKKIAEGNGEKRDPGKTEHNKILEIVTSRTNNKRETETNRRLRSSGKMNAFATRKIEKIKRNKREKRSSLKINNEIIIEPFKKCLSSRVPPPDEKPVVVRSDIQTNRQRKFDNHRAAAIGNKTPSRNIIITKERPPAPLLTATANGSINPVVRCKDDHCDASLIKSKMSVPSSGENQQLDAAKTKNVTKNSTNFLVFDQRYVQELRIDNKTYLLHPKSSCKRMVRQEQRSPLIETIVDN